MSSQSPAQAFPPPDPNAPVQWRWSGIGLPAGMAFALWLAAFVCGAFLSAAFLIGTGNASTEPADLPIWATALAVLGLWIPFGMLVVYGSRSHGSGRLLADLAVRRQWSALWGVPIGIASQLLLVPAVTWLASRVAPDVFDYSEMETRARELVDASSGAWFLLLVVIVVIGAPLVEEAVYRGFLQGSLRRSAPPWVATVVVAALFAAVHFSVIEMPGLFAFALVLGICFERSSGLALPIVAHMAFNGTAIALLAVLE